MAVGLSVVTGTATLPALAKDGWSIQCVTGSDHHMPHSTMPGLVTVPVHAGKTLPPETLANILRQTGLSADEFRRLL